jgi:hypothetical protein
MLWLMSSPASGFKEGVRLSKKKLAGIVIACTIVIVVVIVLVISPLLHTPKPKLTLVDAPNVLNLSAELPPGFSGSYSSTPQESHLLGTGSGSQFYTFGLLITRLHKILV